MPHIENVSLIMFNWYHCPRALILLRNWFAALYSYMTCLIWRFLSWLVVLSIGPTPNIFTDTSVTQCPLYMTCLIWRFVSWLVVLSIGPTPNIFTDTSATQWPQEMSCSQPTSDFLPLGYHGNVFPCFTVPANQFKTLKLTTIASLIQSIKSISISLHSDFN